MIRCKRLDKRLFHNTRIALFQIRMKKIASDIVEHKYNLKDGPSLECREFSCFIYGEKEVSCQPDLNLPRSDPIFCRMVPFFNETLSAFHHHLCHLWCFLHRKTWPKPCGETPILVWFNNRATASHRDGGYGCHSRGLFISFPCPIWHALSGACSIRQAFWWAWVQYRCLWGYLSSTCGVLERDWGRK